jgi:hypothetical protein
MRTGLAPGPARQSSATAPAVTSTISIGLGGAPGVNRRPFNQTCQSSGA